MWACGTVGECMRVEADMCDCDNRTDGCDTDVSQMVQRSWLTVRYYTMRLLKQLSFTQVLV